MNGKYHCNYYNLVKPCPSDQKYHSYVHELHINCVMSPFSLSLNSTQMLQRARPPFRSQEWSHSSPSCMLGKPTPAAAASKTWVHAWFPGPTLQQDPRCWEVLETSKVITESRECSWQASPDTERNPEDNYKKLSKVRKVYSELERPIDEKVRVIGDQGLQEQRFVGSTIYSPFIPITQLSNWYDSSKKIIFISLSHSSQPELHIFSIIYVYTQKIIGCHLFIKLLYYVLNLLHTLSPIVFRKKFWGNSHACFEDRKLASERLGSLLKV